MRVGKDLVAAAATPLVLGILAGGDSYGYAIARRVTELSGGELVWADGMLYPLLHRLERLGFVESVWRTSDSGRERKHYLLSARGRAALADQREQWQVMSRVLDKVWAPSASPAIPGLPDLALGW